MASRLTAISSMATHRILVGLVARYQETTGQAVAFTSMGGVDAARRVRAGHRPGGGGQASPPERARKIGYSTGPSGDYLMRLCEQWGIRDAVAANLVKVPPGVPVGALLAQGEVDLGLQQLSELRGMPGIDIVRSLPPDIQATAVSPQACAGPAAKPMRRGLSLPT